MVSEGERRRRLAASRTMRLKMSAIAALDFWEWSHEDGAEDAVADWVRAHGAIGAGMFQTIIPPHTGPDTHQEPHPELIPEWRGREWPAIGNLVP